MPASLGQIGVVGNDPDQRGIARCWYPVLFDLPAEKGTLYRCQNSCARISSRCRTTALRSLTRSHRHRRPYRRNVGMAGLLLGQDGRQRPSWRATGG
jgi:hypothetical protein